MSNIPYSMALNNSPIQTDKCIGITVRVCVCVALSENAMNNGEICGLLSYAAIERNQILLFARFRSIYQHITYHTARMAVWLATEFK